MKQTGSLPELCDKIIEMHKAIVLCKHNWVPNFWSRYETCSRCGRERDRLRMWA